VGAGDGHMSRLLSEAGFDVLSTDPEPRQPLEYDVRQMNAYELKCEDSAYDLVVSSNVLEHIPDLERACAEMKRILKKDGVMVHSVPTVWCNFVTMLVQPMAYFRNMYLFFTGKLEIKVDKSNSRAKQVLIYIAKVLWNVLNPLRLIMSRGHGVSRSRIRALCIWRRSYWQRRFGEYGIKVLSVQRVPYLYSMHKLFPFKMDSLRRRLGRRYGSVDIYVLGISE
jgi:SAM-dependent methyltransferase